MFVSWWLFDIFCVDAYRDGAVVHEGNLHVGPELSGPDGLSDGLRERIAELLIEGNGLSRSLRRPLW